MESYLTPAGYGEAELVEKRSKFIGRVRHTETEEEALAHIKEMRAVNYDAAHNVYAYSIRNGATRFSDDGEPGGTSGMPTLNVFMSEGITDFCCVVTRYFGGILLGAGGLVRAYSSTAKLALDAAGITRMALWNTLILSCTYAQYERILRLLSEFGSVIQDTDFAADIVMDAIIPADKTDEFTAALSELTSGTAICEITGQRFRGAKIR